MSIIQNANKELLFCIGEYKSEPNNPVLVYDGGKVALEQETLSVSQKKTNFAAEISNRITEKIEQDKALANNALEFYHAVAENGNVEAQFLLGELYNKMETGFYNQSEAARWYHYAAVQGHKEAIHALENFENDDDGRYDAWI